MPVVKEPGDDKSREVLEIMGRHLDFTIAFFSSDHDYRVNSIFQATIDRALQLAKMCGDRVLIAGAPATYPEVEYSWMLIGLLSFKA
jgi:mannose-1-phosphate guanylyltransferase